VEEKLKYKVLAMGWSLRAAAHRLTDKEFRFLNRWANNEGYDYGHIPLSLEGVLDGYRPEESNLWTLPMLPILDQNRFMMLDPGLKGVSVLSAPLIENSPCNLFELKDLNRVHKASKGRDKVLYYFEEFRGISGQWSITKARKPRVSDFSINFFKLRLSRKEFFLVQSLSYKDEKLPSASRESGESLALKLSYSFIL